MSIRTDVSEQLDAFSQTPGAVLIRGDQYWVALDPAAPGMLLALDQDGNPYWTDNSEGTFVDSGWQSVALLNGWVPIGGNWSAPRIRRDNAGNVTLNVAVKDGASGQPAFVLPTGFRPSALTGGQLRSFTTSTNATVLIRPNGNVEPSVQGQSAAEINFTFHL